ncbi:peptidase C14 [Trematosphaeria pertusa]|uniref:Peptidase C14 n=1 Tax=Trematosphaeria pertusa TaxID=390896 RepID=A0A6A6IB00_9PLEO|nr:peptidase C14 [Trematosphaeria pertusa]KAF2247387.1 peptidase C14 [Trematosphaeria pertusa]
MAQRKKSLLIGINYVGSAHELKGCHSDIDNIAEFLSYRGYSNSHRDRVMLSDSPAVEYSSPYYPTGHNILAAMDWLVGEPNCTLFLHYSGHGGQIRDVDGNRTTGLDDSIVPVDFEERGQLSSTLLHEHLVTRMAPNCTLFILMDCCHSGSAVELPFVYRSDTDGNISLMDNLRKGAQLVGEASDLIQRGFTFDKVGEARELLAGATSFFRGLKHMGEQDEEEGVQAGEFAGQYGSERKMVTMISGCRDDQTSADARIQGESTGAMTWAFLETMKKNESPTYAQTLQVTRQLLDQSNYTQIPQLSCGLDLDLENLALVL